jgi:hypothetical protein
MLTLAVQVEDKRYGWHVRQPIVYRYLNKEHVDQFFDSGRLRLTAMPEFRKYPDEELGDAEEGNLAARSTTTNGGSFVFVGQVGHDALVMSCAQRLGDDLKAAFKRDSAFRIKEPISFANAIAQKLRIFREGVEGPCIYTDDTTLQRNAPSHTPSTFFDTDGGFVLGTPNQGQVMREVVGPEFYFKKRAKYQHQCEYRFVWLLHGSAQSHEFVDCPEAVQFCERIDGS